MELLSSKSHDVAIGQPFHLVALLLGTPIDARPSVFENRGVVILVFAAAG